MHDYQLKMIKMSIKAKQWLITLIVLLVSCLSLKSQPTDSTGKKVDKKYQAKAPTTRPFGAEAFKASNKTTIRWLGMAGFLVNSRGTTFMLDPLLEGYDMPLLLKFPIAPKDVPHVDAILATHSDNDHYSVETFKDLSQVTKEYHSTL